MPFKDQPLTFNREAQGAFFCESAWRADLESYQRGDRVLVEDYTIKPKGDLFGWPHTHGWVVVKDGVNVLPGATWSHSLDGAKRLVHAFIAAGEDQSPECARRFWSLVRLTERTYNGGFRQHEPAKTAVPDATADVATPGADASDASDADKDATIALLVATLRKARQHIDPIRTLLIGEIDLALDRVENR